MGSRDQIGLFPIQKNLENMFSFTRYVTYI